MAQETTTVDRLAEHRMAIEQQRAKLGSRLVILAHHYQRPEVVEFGDIRGDSYELSKRAAEADAEYIVFCGVHFMAQSAAVLARPEQRVFHPNPRAGCPMADMASRGQVQRALDEIRRIRSDSRVVPLTYMNTLADVKAVVGEAGGAVCTSSNAARAFNWAYQSADCVLFVPDEHLGRNTAHDLKIPDEQIELYDPRAGELGGLREAQFAGARLILWAGYCHVHTWYQPEHIEVARTRWPGCQVHVHPECRRQVVAQADGSGSTGYLVQVVQKAPAGSTIVIGTEINLILRLAAEHPDKTIVPLDRSLCPNMYRITVRHLAETLQHLPDTNQITVDERDVRGARLSLQRMLEI